MKKSNLQWTVKDLQEKYELIEFPEYQREPTVWALDKKRKLIDSMLRNFDIASIYLYKRDDGNYDCIDGRQRINAILSFLGLNRMEGSDEGASRYDNGFHFRGTSELSPTIYALPDYDGKAWSELTEDQKRPILEYTFNVLEIADIKEADELNLMFLRLQLGVALNAGEKLNAMVGHMRDFIFEPKGLGAHEYFDFLRIPKRRFSRQLTAAQIALNFFSLKEEKKFTRTRFLDLQNFFSTNAEFKNDEDKKAFSAQLKGRLDAAYEYLKDSKLVLKNRAVGVSTFFIVNNLIEKDRHQEVPQFIAFMRLFLDRLEREVKKGIHIEPEYEELLKFQTYVSQAAVERYAIENRQAFLLEYFEHYKRDGGIKR